MFGKGDFQVGGQTLAWVHSHGLYEGCDDSPAKHRSIPSGETPADVSTVSFIFSRALWGCHVACEVNARPPQRRDCGTESWSWSLRAVWLSGSPCCLIRTSRKSPGPVRSWVTGQGRQEARRQRTATNPSRDTDNPNKTPRQPFTADQRREVSVCTDEFLPEC